LSKTRPIDFIIINNYIKNLRGDILRYEPDITRVFKFLKGIHNEHTSDNFIQYIDNFFTFYCIFILIINIMNNKEEWLERMYQYKSIIIIIFEFIKRHFF
jgi:hypothetical protein